MIAELVHQCVEENAHIAQDQEQYQIRYGDLVTRFHVTKGQLDEVSEKIVQRKAQREMMENFIREARKLPDVLDCFDESVWYALVDYVTVYSKEDIRFTFRDGTEIDMSKLSLHYEEKRMNARKHG